MAGIPVTQVSRLKLVNEVFVERCKSVSVSSEETVTDHNVESSVKAVDRQMSQPNQSTVVETDVEMNDSSQQKQQQTIPDQIPSDSTFVSDINQPHPPPPLPPASHASHSGVLSQSQHISSNTKERVRSTEESTMQSERKDEIQRRVHAMGADYIVPMEMISRYGITGHALERIQISDASKMEQYRKFVQSVMNAAYEKSLRKLKKRTQAQIKEMTKQVQHYHDAYIANKKDKRAKEEFDKIHALAEKEIADAKHRLDVRKQFMRTSLEFWKKAMIVQHYDFLCSEITTGPVPSIENDLDQPSKLSDMDALSQDEEYLAMKSELERAQSVRNELFDRLKQAKHRLSETSMKMKSSSKNTNDNDQSPPQKESSHSDSVVENANEPSDNNAMTEDEKMTDLKSEPISEQISSLFEKRLNLLHSDSVFVQDSTIEDGLSSSMVIPCEWLQELNDRLKEIQEVRSLDLSEVEKSYNRARELKQRLHALQKRRDHLNNYLSKKDQQVAT